MSTNNYNKNIDDLVQRRFPKTYQDLLEKNRCTSQDNPVGILLGGQPGAGKSFGTEKIKEQLNSNVMVINGDEFREYHPNFNDINQQYGADAAKYTGEFAGKMVGMIRDEAIKSRFNIVIEGTFRTADTPLKELENFKKEGYQTQVVICTCPKEVSWNSTLARAKAMEDAGLPPRFVPKEHHDLVIQNLPTNADKVFASGLADTFKVYSREKLLFDNHIHKMIKPGTSINSELHRDHNNKNTNLLNVPISERNKNTLESNSLNKGLKR